MRARVFVIVACAASLSWITAMCAPFGGTSGDVQEGASDGGARGDAGTLVDGNVAVDASDDSTEIFPDADNGASDASACAESGADCTDPAAAPCCAPMACSSIGGSIFGQCCIPTGAKCSPGGDICCGPTTAILQTATCQKGTCVLF